MTSHKDVSEMKFENKSLFSLVKSSTKNSEQIKELIYDRDTGLNI